MQKKNNYNSIISFVLIVSTILMPLSFIPKKAEAQSISGYSSGILSQAVSTLPQCQKLIGNSMKSLFSGNATSTATSFTSGLSLGGISKFGDLGKTNEYSKDLTNTIDSTANSATQKLTSLSTFDETNYKLGLEIKANTEATKESTASIDAEGSCIEGIGRLVVKMLLQKLTVSTVKWINSGFDGSPSFIQDPGKFFGDIAENEILQFGVEINDADLFPFGKKWLQRTATAYNRKFQDNAQYSLNELIQETTPEYSATTFEADFSQGGWNAWTALTQVPANNPLGFQWMADNELQQRQAGTKQSTAEQFHEALSQANGYLGDYRCSADSGITQSDKKIALAAGEKDPCIVAGGSWEYVTPGAMIADKATEVIGYESNVYLDAEDLNDAVAAIIDALLGQFSSSIYENGFANLTDEGSDGTLILSDYDYSSTKTQVDTDFADYLTSSWLRANPDFNIRTDLTQALIDEQRTYADKLTLQNKELLSTTDGENYTTDAGWVTCAKENKTCTVSGTQKVRYGASGKYYYKTVTGSIRCNNATFGDPISNIEKTCSYGHDSAESNTYGLIPAINQLDYCIPGPHPGWEADSAEILAAATDTILPETKESLSGIDDKGKIVNMAKSVLPMAAGATVAGLITTATGGAFLAIGTVLGTSMLPVVGTIVGAVVGVLVSVFVDLFSNDDDEENVRIYYSNILGGFTGYKPATIDASDAKVLNIESKAGVMNVLNSILDRYATIVNQVFTSDVLPSVAGEAATYFNQLIGYYQMISDNTEKINSLNQVVNTLGKIKDTIEELNTRYKTEEGTFKADLVSSDPEYNSDYTETNYESELDTQIAAFGRISSSMINGDDIASADTILKQIVDRKNYIYNNLLKGPYGCEKELETPKNFPFPFNTEDRNKNDIYDKKFQENRWDKVNNASVKRMTYPLPIIYDYNKLKKGEPIPDPWESGYTNVMPNADANSVKDKDQRSFYSKNITMVGSLSSTGIPETIKVSGEDLYLGPGFLSFVYFSDPNDNDDEKNVGYHGDERLQINDLVPQCLRCQQWVSVGLRGDSSDNNSKRSSSFETIIGVY